MRQYIKDLFQRTNNKLHRRLRERLNEPSYRADIFVYDILAQLANYLEANGINNTIIAEELDIDRSNVTQFFGKDSNVKVKTLFKYLDSIGLTIEHPKITEFDIENIYQEFEKETEYEDEVIYSTSTKIDDKNKKEPESNGNLLLEDLGEEFSGSDTRRFNYGKTG